MAKVLIGNLPERGLAVIGFLNKTQVGQVLERLHVWRVERSTERVCQDKVAFLHDSRNAAINAFLLGLLKGRLNKLLSRVAPNIENLIPMFAGNENVECREDVDVSLGQPGIKWIRSRHHCSVDCSREDVCSVRRPINHGVVLNKSRRDIGNARSSGSGPRC